MHFMLEEIRSEPAIVKTFKSREFPDLEETIESLEDSEIIYAVGNGTSHNAAIYLSILLNRKGLNCIPIFSSETGKWLSKEGTKSTSIVFSQSGESTDIIESVNYLKKLGSKIIGVTNEKNSRLDKLSDLRLFTEAGREISVAATKSHITQLLVSLKIYFYDREVEFLKILEEITSNLILVEQNDKSIKEIGKSKMLDTVFLGSGLLYPIALEASLKLMETSNVISYAFPTREFLHGPRQLIDENWSVFMLSSDPKVKSEVESLKGKLVEIPDFMKVQYGMSSNNEFIDSILYLFFGQLVSYYTSIGRGLNPDSPSKLRKIVK